MYLNDKLKAHIKRHFLQTFEIADSIIKVSSISFYDGYYDEGNKFTVVTIIYDYIKHNKGGSADEIEDYFENAMDNYGVKRRDVIVRVRETDEKFTDWLAAKIGVNIGKPIRSERYVDIYEVDKFREIKIFNAGTDSLGQLINKKIDVVQNVYSYGKIEVPRHFSKKGYSGNYTGISRLRPANTLDWNEKVLFYAICERVYSSPSLSGSIKEINIDCWVKFIRHKEDFRKKVEEWLGSENYQGAGFLNLYCQTLSLDLKDTFLSFITAHEPTLAATAHRLCYIIERLAETGLKWVRVDDKGFVYNSKNKIVIRNLDNDYFYDNSPTEVFKNVIKEQAEEPVKHLEFLRKKYIGHSTELSNGNRMTVAAFDWDSLYEEVCTVFSFDKMLQAIDESKVTDMIVHYRVLVQSILGYGSRFKCEVITEEQMEIQFPSERVIKALSYIKKRIVGKEFIHTGANGVNYGIIITSSYHIKDDEIGLLYCLTHNGKFTRSYFYGQTIALSSLCDDLETLFHINIQCQLDTDEELPLSLIKEEGSNKDKIIKKLRSMYLDKAFEFQFDYDILTIDKIEPFGANAVVFSYTIFNTQVNDYMATDNMDTNNKKHEIKAFVKQYFGLVVVWERNLNPPFLIESEKKKPEPNEDKKREQYNRIINELLLGRTFTYLSRGKKVETTVHKIEFTKRGLYKFILSSPAFNTYALWQTVELIEDDMIKLGISNFEYEWVEQKDAPKVKPQTAESEEKEVIEEQDSTTGKEKLWRKFFETKTARSFEIERAHVSLLKLDSVYFTNGGKDVIIYGAHFNVVHHFNPYPDTKLYYLGTIIQYYNSLAPMMGEPELAFHFPSEATKINITVEHPQLPTSASDLPQNNSSEETV
jgi:hypothetical protein